jgi:hypothetical protein
MTVMSIQRPSGITMAIPPSTVNAKNRGRFRPRCWPGRMRRSSRDRGLAILLAVRGETALLSSDQHLHLARPSVGRRRVETPERSQIALGHGQRLATDPFALTLPSDAPEGVFGARCWPHMPVSLLWLRELAMTHARRCQIRRG